MKYMRAIWIQFVFWATLSILAKAAHCLRESRAEGRGMSELFEPYPPEAERASCSDTEKNETFGVKKSTVERKKQIESK